ncbi:hypothetical protein [Ralstonia phage RP12]|nr:hypothetical protein FDH28_gp103 [Ralstonia phage RP12]BAW19077.1 hypothetical protein [Ralstonia phage RP12]
MRNYILAIVIALTASSAFAVNTCDTLPTKAERTNCWSNLVGSYLQEADEYNFAVQESKEVPAVVKQKVEAKRQAISAEANRVCKKGELGYPDDACYIEQIQKFKDFTYQETYKFGVPDQRLN